MVRSHVLRVMSEFTSLITFTLASWVKPAALSCEVGSEYGRKMVEWLPVVN